MLSHSHFFVSCILRKEAVHNIALIIILLHNIYKKKPDYEHIITGHLFWFITGIIPRIISYWSCLLRNE